MSVSVFVCIHWIVFQFCVNILMKQKYMINKEVFYLEFVLHIGTYEKNNDAACFHYSPINWLLFIEEA